MIFDVGRSQELKYEIVEAVKNGTLLKTKYQVELRCHDSPHIFIFSNQEADFDQLSGDRWNYIDELSDHRGLGFYFPPDKFPEVRKLLINGQDPWFAREEAGLPHPALPRPRPPATPQNTPPSAQHPRQRARSALPASSARSALPASSSQPMQWAPAPPMPAFEDVELVD